MNLEVSRQILEKKKIPTKFNEILSVGAELFHVDGRMDRHTDITKQIVVFRNFAKTPKSFRGVSTISGVIHNSHDIS